MKDDYHSAIKVVNRVANPVAPRESYSGRHGFAFVHDMAEGLPVGMGGAAVLYGDPPWRHGYETFNARAGREGVAMPWPDLMARLGRDIRASGKPAVMVNGKQAAKALDADDAVPCLINRGKALAFLWGGVSLPADLDTVEILHLLAADYGVVGDPFCGFGRAGRIFAQHGKRYIMSDFNAECIGYIAANEGTWQ